MGNFTYVLPYNFVNGTTADANEVNANFFAGRDAHNASMHGITGHAHTGATGDGPSLASLPELVPIGSINAFYDFNGALTFDASKWAYCNGQAIAVGSIGVQTLPDLSNRYLVGFGTEGGMDNGSAAFSSSPVGNAFHQINIQHSHTVNAHTHTIAGHTHTTPNHSHTVDSHTHTFGTLKFQVCDFSLSGGAHLTFYDTAGADEIVLDAPTGAQAGGDFVPTQFDSGLVGNTYFTKNGSGNTGSTSPGTDSSGGSVTGSTALVTDSSSPGTNTALSTTQSIQPRSIRVRWIMRIQ